MSEFINNEAKDGVKKPDFSQFGGDSGTSPGDSKMLGSTENPKIIDLNEVIPASERVKGEPAINIFLRALTKSGASDLHMNYNVPPILRLHGELCPIKFKPLNAVTMKKMLYQILNEDQRADCENKIEVDSCYEIAGIGRYRINIYSQLYGLAAVFRAIPVKILSIKDVELDESIAKRALYSQGFIVVTGATGSGKSTTLAAMIDYINQNSNKHIVTIEDPLEFVHKSKKSLINRGGA
jgi:twitching motility protein PilT